MNKTKNCRNTIQKQLIFEAVYALHNHPSADEIYEQVLNAAPNISKATVYRNLSLMSESGEVLKIAVPNASDRFDFNTMPHYHMLCTGCGRVFDVKTDALDIMEKVNGSEDFEITGYSLLFEGKCSCCR